MILIKNLLAYLKILKFFIKKLNNNKRSNILNIINMIV